MLSLAATVEAASQHPLAKAIVQGAQSQGLSLHRVLQCETEAGLGVQATVEMTGSDVRQVFVGNAAFLRSHGVVISRDAEQVWVMLIWMCAETFVYQCNCCHFLLLTPPPAQ